MVRFVQAGAVLFLALLYSVLLYTSDPNSEFSYQFAEWVNQVGVTPELWFWPILIGWNVLLLVVAILVTVDSVRKVRAGKTQQLATGVFVVKLAAIPYFLLNFLLWGALAGVGLALGGWGVFVIAIAVPLTWFTMLSTSIYGWASIVLLRREGRIGKVQVALYAILLCVFVTDIVAGILLFVQSRRRHSHSLSVATPTPGAPGS